MDPGSTPGISKEGYVYGSLIPVMLDEFGNPPLSSIDIEGLQIVEKLILSKQDYDALARMIKNPPEPNQRLKDLFKEFEK